MKIRAVCRDRYLTGHKMWLQRSNHGRVGVFTALSCRHQFWAPWFDICINYGEEHGQQFPAASSWPQNCRSGSDKDWGLVQVYTSSLNGANDEAPNTIFYIFAIIYVFLYIGNKFLKSPWESQRWTSEAERSNTALGYTNAKPSRNQETLLHLYLLRCDPYQNSLLITRIFTKLGS